MLLKRTYCLSSATCACAYSLAPPGSWRSVVKFRSFSSSRTVFRAGHALLHNVTLQGSVSSGGQWRRAHCCLHDQILQNGKDFLQRHQQLRMACNESSNILKNKTNKTVISYDEQLSKVTEQAQSYDESKKHV